MRIVFVVLLLMTSVLSSPLATASTKPSQINRVIYVTFDGVRWQDIYLDKSHFPMLWQKHAKNLSFYGMPGTPLSMEVASIAISLPSYQSQMSGSVQPCYSNYCGRIGVETLAENLVHQFGFNKRDVATFASWWHITLSVEHIPETTFANTGNTPVVDPDTGKPDGVMQWLNYQQAHDHPHKERFPNSRYDKYTYAQAMHYLEKYRPRFLWISFVESDEAAHLNDRPYYDQMLSYYDQVLDNLFTKLKEWQLDKDTLVIVTTDHGRGNGVFWTDHGPLWPESKRTWAFVLNGKLKNALQEEASTHYSTLSIRPTVEAFLKA